MRTLFVILALAVSACAQTQAPDPTTPIIQVVGTSPHQVTAIEGTVPSVMALNFSLVTDSNSAKPADFTANSSGLPVSGFIFNVDPVNFPMKDSAYLRIGSNTTPLAYSIDSSGRAYFGSSAGLFNIPLSGSISIKLLWNVPVNYPIGAQFTFTLVGIQTPGAVVVQGLPIAGPQITTGILAGMGTLLVKSLQWPAAVGGNGVTADQTIGEIQLTAKGGPVAFSSIRVGSVTPPTTDLSKVTDIKFMWENANPTAPTDKQLGPTQPALGVDRAGGGGVWVSFPTITLQADEFIKVKITASAAAGSQFYTSVALPWHVAAYTGVSASQFYEIFPTLVSPR